ncbi:MAG: succinate dehydrogenase/fumarate reductase cytochrome b subunit [Acidobacteriota bacterium]
MANPTVVTHLKEPVRAEQKSEAYLDLLQMLTGAALILFMWSHMILVASVNLGSGVMNAIAGFLEHHYLAQTGGPVIGFLFLLHFVMAARKIPFRNREQAVMWYHTMRLNHLDTWLWIVQVLTAFIILIMGSIHMWTVLTDLPITAAKSAARIQGGWWLLFYIILLPLVELHVGIGFYRIGVKWGWIKRANRAFFSRFENRLSMTFIIIGLITLFTFFFIM